MVSVKDFNPLAPETVECPYHFYTAMRREAPVYEVPGMGFFIVSKYADVERVLLDTERFSSKSGPGVRQQPPQDILDIWAKGWMPTNTLLTNDPPDHRRYRGLVNKAFTPRRVAEWEPTMRAITTELIDSFINDGCVELVQHAKFYLARVKRTAFGIRERVRHKQQELSHCIIGSLHH